MSGATMYPTVAYFMNTEYPNSKAHSIQITKILFSLSQHTEVIFFCNKIASKQDKIYQDILNKYGYDLSKVKFVEIEKKKLTGLSFYYTLKKINTHIPKNVVIYTRSYNLAKRFARTKFWHKHPVILESHKKNGYDKEDSVENSKYSNQRKLFEIENHNKKNLQKLYCDVDGIIFTSEESRKIVEKDLNINNTAFIWHPLAPHSTPKARDKTIIYSGSLGPDKLIELLLDGLAVAETNITIDMIGGTTDDVAKISSAAEVRGVRHNLSFLDRVTHRELPSILGRYTYGLSLMEGLKVADYVECGLIPVIPKISMYTEIFKNNTAIFFEPDNPLSLNETLKTIQKPSKKHLDVNIILDKYSIKNTAESILKVIKNV